ncbi:MAG: DUF1275 domain-containing protein [Chitinophagales bacterium]|nr:DUF1275 domain-containing protein [Chitinophagales bacterium]
MLRKYSNSRTLSDNIKLGTLTAFTAGMVNVASLLIFFAFTSNVTGHYAILAAEIVKGNVYQVAVVFSWIFLFFLGSFTSNLIVIHFNARSKYFAHATPILLEMICLTAVGFYGHFFYRETLAETELLLSLMLFAMGLQNGLTASISNFTVKTTHLTGTTTDLGILCAMFTKKEFRSNPELLGKAKLLSAITVSFIAGAVLSGLIYMHIQFRIFFLISFCLLLVILYDLYRVRIMRYLAAGRRSARGIAMGSIQPVAGIAERKEQEVAAY